MALAFSLEQLFFSNNELDLLSYPDCGGYFKSLHSLLLVIFQYGAILFFILNTASLEDSSSLLLGLASNKIEDLKSVDSIDSFPSLMVSINLGHCLRYL